MNLLAIYGLLGHGLLCGALVSRLPLGHLRQRAALIATTIALLAGIAPLLHALGSPRPKHRYPVTFPTRLFGVLRRLLPSRLLDRILAKSA